MRGRYWPAALPLGDPVCSLLQCTGNLAFNAYMCVIIKAPIII